jgi:hypothetical protein
LRSSPTTASKGPSDPAWIAWAGEVDELNHWFQRRSGCASAEPYPALKQDDWNRDNQAKATAKGASWKKNPFAATIILLLLRQFSLILFCPRQVSPQNNQ